MELPFSCCPSSFHARFVPQVFRVLLFRRLWLPLPLTKRTCGCGRLLDSSGHHRAACTNVGVLGRRGFALESAAARVCREAGGRVSVNQYVRDLDIAAPTQPTTADCRWPPSVPWRAVGHRHYDGFPSQLHRGSSCKTLLNRIPLVGDVQAAWLLLVHCAAARATCSLRCVDPEAVEGFARRHDQHMMECLSSILHTNLAEWSDEARDIATLPMSLGGLGVRSAVRTSGPAHWASWADCLAMVQERHPDVASLFVDQLAHPTTPCLQAVARVARDLTGLGGFQLPSWRELAMGARPEPREPEHFEPGCTRDGWQHEVASRVEETF